MKVKKLDIHSDSLLIIYHVKKEWKMKDEKLKSYQEYLIKQDDQFEEIKFILLIRDNNQLIEVLYSILALIIQIGYDKEVQYVSIKIKNDFTNYCLVEKETNGKMESFGTIISYISL